jgi:SH3 domain-containing YSC84-like protein 1
MWRNRVATDIEVAMANLVGARGFAAPQRPGIGTTARRNEGGHMRSNPLVRNTAPRWLGLLAVAALAIAGGTAWAQSEQQELVNASERTLSDFMHDPDMTWLQQNIDRAKGVLIAPTIVKAGWIFGGSGGRAVLFVRDARTAHWDGPAFYNIGAVSVGFQAGVAASETLTLVMTDEGVNSLLASSAKLGGDLSIAAGPVGAGTSADITSDFVAYSRSKGVYGGVTLKGSVIGVADDWNRAYYGASVLPPDILLHATAHNSQADRLAAALDRAAEPRRTSSAE